MYQLQHWKALLLVCEGLDVILQNNWRAGLTLPEALNA